MKRRGFRLVPTSLAGRLIGGAALFTIVALGATLVVMSHLLERFVTGQIDQRLDNKLIALVSQTKVAPDGMVSIEGDADGPPFDKPHHRSFWIVAGPRNMRASSWLPPGGFTPPLQRDIEAAPAPPAPLGGDLSTGGKPRTLHIAGPANEDMHVRAIIRTIGVTPVTILAAAPRRAITDPTREALMTLAGVVVLLGVASLVAATTLVRVVLKPLTRILREVADVRVGRRTSLSTGVPSEVRPLVDELNALLAQNAANLGRARKHVANLAHGLKTPLATLSLGVARLDGEAAAPLQNLVSAIERRVRHHLGRARAAALDGPVRSQTMLRPHLVDLLDALAKIYAEKRVEGSLVCADELAVACEPQDIDEIFGNLLDNAFKYTRTRVGCAVRTDGAMVVVEIVDDGPGLNAAEIARVLRPGQRLDEDIPGFGFGLPIARELVELYGGELTLRGRDGLTVALALPALR